MAFRIKRTFEPIGDVEALFVTGLRQGDCCSLAACSGAAQEIDCAFWSSPFFVKRSETSATNSGRGPEGGKLTHSARMGSLPIERRFGHADKRPFRPRAHIDEHRLLLAGEALECLLRTQVPSVTTLIKHNYPLQ